MHTLKILILDDEPIVGKYLQPALMKHEMEVETFQDPDQALARMNETQFDVVVTDIRMKGMDGLRVLEWIRPRFPRTKVIVITGYGSREVERDALSKGAFAFITKPFKPRDLQLVIQKAAQALGYPGSGSAEGTGL